jgi:pilus assembly protein CpaF
MVHRLARELEDELFGLGPLEELLRDSGVSEVMVNGPAHVFVERGGRIERAGLILESDSRVVELVRRVIGPLNLRLDETSPMVDARLPDGSRLNAVIPPLCLNGPTVTIRRFREKPFTTDELVQLGTMTPEVASFLECAVGHRANIIVSGGTSSGKTTLLNVLSSFIPDGERLITIEDAAELRIVHPNVVSLESRPPNIEGRGEVTVRDLVRNALRMRPDRIIVGEVRGAEALDMLQAMNTGHPGSLSTAHANSPSDLLDRLETMVLMSEVRLDQEAVRRQVGSAIDLVVHTERTAEGRRVVSQVVAVSRASGGGYALEQMFAAGGEGPGGLS